MRKTWMAVSFAALLAAGLAGPGLVALGQEAGNSWQFAVAGDSRNCGDVVMPAIAASALRHHPAFYWHLGDLRFLADFDEDMQDRYERHEKGLSAAEQNRCKLKDGRLTFPEYQRCAWDDFIANQIAAFRPIPFYVGIGNHETYSAKTRGDFVAQFADWLNSRTLREQRLKDDPEAYTAKTYFHWVERGVDFIYLDNATPDQFDDAQMAWFAGVLGRDKNNPDIRTIVVGMHAALPDSIAAGHSMNDYPVQRETGRRVYLDLLRAQEEWHKHVYVLASHSHFYLAGIFENENSRVKSKSGQVLPGLIVGTGGAQRYELPKGVKTGPGAKEFVYGYVLATVHPDGQISFEFQEVGEVEISKATGNRYTDDLIRLCIDKNKKIDNK